MNRHFDSHFQKDIITILPGDLYVSSEDIFISTVLGSCISIAFFDKENGIGGLNHFMLPRTSKMMESNQDEAGRYGEFAMELLINEMIAKGAERKNIQAKIFGGGNILADSNSNNKNMTGINNINFALNFLKNENINIAANDTGGMYARKIYFNPPTEKVYLKYIQKSSVSMETMEIINQREKEYIIRMENEKGKTDNIKAY